MAERSCRRCATPHCILLRVLLLLSLFLPTTSSTQRFHSQSPPTSSPPFDSLPSTAAFHRHHLRRILLGLLFGCLTGFFASLLFVFSIRHCVLYASNTPILNGPVVFSPVISPKSLQAAVSDDTRMTHLAGSGRYHRLILDDGLSFAVKILEPDSPTEPTLSPPQTPPPPQGKAAQRRVQQGLEVLAMVRHRNVMSLLAYVRDGDRFSLVYDYAAAGSLEDAMKRVRSNQLRMGWDVRHRIAVGIVKGLRHLHFECSPRILHHDLKPTNVVLDDEFEPRLADTGLSRLFGCGGGRGLPSCYLAPECLQSCRYTDKSDIFSFGVILGMLLTGRDPSDPFFGGDSGSLGRWLRHSQQTGEAKQALDKGVLGEEVEEDEMLMAVRIAVVCLSDLPADRPSSDELVAMLTQLHSF